MSDNPTSAVRGPDEGEIADVVHIAESFAGGVAAAVHDYRRNAPQLRHHLLYSRRADAPLTASALEGFATVEEFPKGHLARIKAVRRFTQRFDRAVLHAHSSFAGAYTRLAVRNTDAKPIVYTPHCFAFERRDVPLPARVGFHAVESMLARNTEVFATCSRRELALARQLPGSSQSAFVPNVPPHDALDLGVVEKAQHVRPSAELTLAGSGRFGAQKDPAFFISAVKSLRESGVEFHAMWIGGGDDAALLEAMARERIEVTGWLPREEVLVAMARADVYLHTARWEGFPVGVLEVSALGIPAVVRSIPAFNGVDMPIQIATPSELQKHWAKLRSDEGRFAVVRAQRAALADCTDEEQARSLNRVYRSALQLQPRS